MIKDNTQKQEIIQNNTTELSKEDTNKPGIITSLDENEIIKHYGGLDNYLALKLLDVMENAVAPDNKGELHIDYRARMKGVENIIKLTNKSFDGNGVHINFFSSPKHLKH